MASELVQVDINTATIKQLETSLFGVGRAKAEAIYTARTKRGYFSSLEELMSVPGVGRNILDQNKALLLCNPPSVEDMNVSDSSSQPSDSEQSGSDEQKVAGQAMESASSVYSRLSADQPCSSSSTNQPASGMLNCKGPLLARRSLRRVSTHQDSNSSVSSSFQSCFTNKASSSKSSMMAGRCFTNGINTSNTSQLPPVLLPQKLKSNVGGQINPHFNKSETNINTSANISPEPLSANAQQGSASPMVWVFNDQKPLVTISDEVCMQVEDENGYDGSLDETELQRLRVRENSNEADLSSNEDSTDPCQVAVVTPMQQSALLAGTVTPFEESEVTPSNSYLMSHISRSKAQNTICSSNTSPYGSSIIPLFESGQNSSNEGMSSSGQTVKHNSIKYTRRKKLYTPSGTPNISCEDVAGGSISRAMCAEPETLRVNISELVDSSKEVFGLEDSDPEQDFIDVDMDEYTTNKDKKQVKRKYDIGGEQKTLTPVKKPCKSEELSPRPPPPPQLDSWLGQFSSWSPQQQTSALDSLIAECGLAQIRHLHHTILPTFQRDFISLLPKEVALYVLSFLSPKDLLIAAQICKYWNLLAADNLLWREKCREAGIEDFVDHMDKRRKRGNSVGNLSPYKLMFQRRQQIECNWRTNKLREPEVLQGHDEHVITCLQFSGNTIVSGSDDNTLRVWNANTGKCIKILSGHTGGVWSSQMKDNIIVSGSTDRTLRVWNAETGSCIQTLYGHTSTVRCLHLHGKIVVSGSRDATLRMWDVQTGVCEHVLVGHVAAVRCVQYNGKLVVSGAYDFNVKVWDPHTEHCIHTLSGHSNRVYSLQFDGKYVVSGSLDTTIRVWDVESGRLKHTLLGHQSLTSGMELHNNILISGNADSTIKVWDIVTGQCLQTLSGPNKHKSAVTCLQFINQFVVTSSDDGTVKLWDLHTGEFVRNLVRLYTGNSGGVVWRIRASETKLVCAVGSRNGTEETKLLVLNFDIDDEEEDTRTVL